MVGMWPVNRSSHFRIAMLTCRARVGNGFDAAGGSLSKVCGTSTRIGTIPSGYDLMAPGRLGFALLS